MESDFDRKVNSALRTCDGFNVLYDYKIGEYLLIYAFTNECIKGYINSFNLKGKSLLTTGSSCDQVFNAILKGCEDITLVDVNPFTKYYYYLKSAALLSFSMEDYLHFLVYMGYPTTFKNNYNVLNKKDFDKIKYYMFNLNAESYYFWDVLFSKFDGLTIRNMLFSGDQNKLDIIKNSNLYLKSKANYELLKSRLECVKPKFIESNILTYESDKLYDNIWLSNILINMDINGIKEVMDKYSKYLNNSGKLLLSYLYSTDENSVYEKEWAQIYDLDLVRKTLSDYNLRLLTFDGIDKKDSILTYKKTL